MNYAKLKLIVFPLMFVSLVASTSWNVFRIVPNNIFSTFEHNSETLVLGTLIADRHNKEITRKGNLGFASIGEEFVYEVKYIYQGYALIDEDALVDLSVKIRVDAEVPNKNPVIAVSEDPRLDAYVGRTIRIDETQRIITGIQHTGDIAYIDVSGPVLKPAPPESTIVLSGHKVDPKEIVVHGYTSQYGLQGRIYSSLAKTFGLTITDLNLLTSVGFSLLIVLLTFFYRKIFPQHFSIAFFFSVLLSPWLTSYARNLYWAPPLWILPAVCAAAYFLAPNWRWRTSAMTLLYLAYTIRCLSGYEYISSVILFAAAPFLYRFLNPSTEWSRHGALKHFFIICFTGAAGFFTALSKHAYMRSDSLLGGFKEIYLSDVTRRTYGNPQTHSLLQVLKSYFVKWDTDFLTPLPGRTFILLLLFCVGVIFYLRYKKVGPLAWDYTSLLISFIVAPLSWHILAKSHSSAHPQLNFVLWYFGFAGALLYVSVGSFHALLKNIGSQP